LFFAIRGQSTSGNKLKGKRQKFKVI